MRNSDTLECLGLWEKLNNLKFKGDESPPLQEADINAFTMIPSRWIELTNAIGIITKKQSYGKTFAQYDIAIKFAS